MTRRAPADPPPDVACGTCRVGLSLAGSPDAERQRVEFTRAHPPGNGHRWVAKLPDDHGDVAWGWTPGSGLPFPRAARRSNGRSQTNASTTAETGGQRAVERTRRRSGKIAARQGRGS